MQVTAMYEKPFRQGPVESDGVANEVHSHGVQAILLVQRAHGHLVQVVALVRLRVSLIIPLDKPAELRSSVLIQADACLMVSSALQPSFTL